MPITNTRQNIEILMILELVNSGSCEFSGPIVARNVQFLVDSVMLQAVEFIVAGIATSLFFVMYKIRPRIYIVINQKANLTK